MWEVELEQSGDHATFSTKKKALSWIAGVAAFDKRNGIEGEKYNLHKEGEDFGEWHELV